TRERPHVRPGIIFQDDRMGCTRQPSCPCRTSRTREHVNASLRHHSVRKMVSTNNIEIILVAYSVLRHHDLAFAMAAPSHADHEPHRSQETHCRVARSNSPP